MNHKTIFVVDDDPKIREALQWLFESVQLKVRLFESAQAFLAVYSANLIGCLLIDVRMPGMSGLGVIGTIELKKNILPIIVMTGHGDIPMAVRAMKAGAIDFISKPFNDQYLLDQIQNVLNQTTNPFMSKENELVDSFLLLTPRERDIFTLVIAGKLNKQIAGDLNIALSTVELHRSRVMQKMHTKTLAGLIRSGLLLERLL